MVFFDGPVLNGIATSAMLLWRFGVWLWLGQRLWLGQLGQLGKWNGVGRR